jgi:hypothetical protein
MERELIGVSEILKSRIFCELNRLGRKWWSASNMLLIKYREGGTWLNRLLSDGRSGASVLLINLCPRDIGNIEF